MSSIPIGPWSHTPREPLDALPSLEGGPRSTRRPRGGRLDSGRDAAPGGGEIALEPYPQLAELTVEDLLLRLDQVPETIRTAVRNNGGGHVNHQFFWDILGPRGGGAPKDTIADAIKRDFGSFEQFQSLFTDAATRHFGAGWAFLVVNPSSPGMWSTSGSARAWLQARPGVTSTETAGGARPSVTVVPIL